MKIIQQSHDIISWPGDACQSIEKAGRTCYKSEDKITKGSSEPFVKMLLERKHEAMIEFNDMTVRFITNRGVTHELVRHRLCSFAQESTRYVKYNGEMEFIRPVWWNDEKTEGVRVWLQAMDSAEHYYRLLLSKGWKAQQAREVLPNSLKTEIVVKANLREWRYIFKLRCASTAHPQMYELMRPLLIECQKKIPIIFDDIQY